MSLSDEHRRYLIGEGVSAETVDACGAETVERGILFTYNGPDKVSHQLKPDAEHRRNDKRGKPMKYEFSRGESNFVNILRDSGTGPVLIVEGTKQALAAHSWAGQEYSVIGLSGSTMWPKHDWDFCEGRDVFVCFDGDAATNYMVYVMAEKFGKELKSEGASSVLFVQIPLEDDGKTGLDDHLKQFAEDRRSKALSKLIRRADRKPADIKPKPRPSDQADTEQLDSGGREVIAVNGDLYDVTRNLIGALKTRWDGHFLFNYGQTLACLDGPSTVPLEDGDLLALLAKTVMMVTRTPATSHRPEKIEPGARPDGQTLKILAASEDQFTELKAVVRFPFVRPDGTVCTEPGYDESTRTVLVKTEGLEGLQVPENPTEDERSAALDLIMNDWLADMPFPTEKDRAHALALIVTPFVRNLFYIVPMAIINGLQMGVGKNLLVDCLAMITTGSWAVPMPYVHNDDELRKQITSAFRTGAELMAFDEAHSIGGEALARTLTSTTYADRILGMNKIAEFPNTVTWIAMGNQVQVNGDCSRRVYWIDLKPTGANPQDRDAESFRHPNLKQWTETNRGRLVSAVLTIVRAWFAAGQPHARRGATLGSYEDWDKTVGGIVTYAGLSGFMSDIKEKRSESDFDGIHWNAHILWLREVFGATTFVTADVRREAVNSVGSYEAPPGMEDTSGKDYTRKLGMAYNQKVDRWYGSLRLVKAGVGHNNVTKWAIEEVEDGGMGGPGGTSTPTHYEKTLQATYVDACDAHTYIERVEHPPTPPSPQDSDNLEGNARSMTAFDLETCGADELFRRPDFVRIGAALGLSPTSDIESLVSHLHTSEQITGHNILGFDLMALARWHGADYEALAAKSFDTLIAAKQIDPPLSKGMPKGYYGLDALAERLGVAGKTNDIKALARKHGGFDQIPPDDAEYTEYLDGDVAASQAVSEALWDQAQADPYIAREHRVQAIMGRMTLNGFRVDEALVTERYQAGQDKLNGIREMLHARYGFPSEGAAPQRSSAGKAALYEALRASGLGPQWLDQNWQKNKDGTLSLAKEVLTQKAEELRGPKPAASDLCDAILSMNGVRSIYGNCRDWLVNGRVHPSISPEQASGRWSVTKPGLTVVGKRGGKVTERAIYIADEGHVLMAFDADQVDMRAIAAECQDPAYMALFIPTVEKPKVDPHTDIARMVGLSREESKPIGHGWNYGMGVEGQVRNGVDRDKAVKFDEGMKESFPRLVEWKNEVREIGQSAGILTNGFGRRMRLNPAWAYTQAPALMGQGGTRDILAEGLLKLPAEIFPMLRVVVHDEIVVSIPEDIVTDVARTVIECMTFVHRGVPITWGQSKPGKSWADCYAK